MTPQDILDFWFIETNSKQWFEKDEAFDDLIRQRFTTLYEDVLEEKMASWRSTPEGRLAEILILDQFSRNMFRDTPRAFGADDIALTLARAAVESGDDMKVEATQRGFLYLPFMHSESIEAHEEATKLFDSLGDETMIKYEQMHKEIIERFGRYPHRNKILERTSTPEEEFLKTNPGF